MSWKCLQVEAQGAVGVVRLHRPEALNALNSEIMEELVQCLQQMDANEAIRCIVLAGDDRAFAAGADIKEMAEASHIEMLQRDNIARWDKLRKITKPIVAAVSGFALGGGCELAMSCDILVEMILTGRLIGAQEALERGLVSRVANKATWLEEALALAQDIAKMSPLALRMAKEMVLKSFETPLAEGLEYERRSFYMLFGSHDQVEGMQAFLAKRPATFTGK